MGVDCRIFLPGHVRLRDVVSVMGVAVGFQPVRKTLQGSGYYTEVAGISSKETSCIEMPYIVFDGRHTSYHFECDTRPGDRLLMPKSTAFWALVGCRLVDFFGGVVDFNDCDDSDNDYERRNKGVRLNAPSDGDEWHSLQDRIAAVKSITRAELENFTGDVGYNYASDGYEYNFDPEGRMVRGTWKSSDLLAA